jgi:hypothetical protein
MAEQRHYALSPLFGSDGKEIRTNHISVNKISVQHAFQCEFCSYYKRMDRTFSIFLERTVAKGLQGRLSIWISPNSQQVNQ